MISWRVVKLLIDASNCSTSACIRRCAVGRYGVVQFYVLLCWSDVHRSWSHVLSAAAHSTTQIAYRRFRSSVVNHSWDGSELSGLLSLTHRQCPAPSFWHQLHSFAVHQSLNSASSQAGRAIQKSAKYAEKSWWSRTTCKFKRYWKLPQTCGVPGPGLRACRVWQFPIVNAENIPDDIRSLQVPAMHGELTEFNELLQ